ncbi:hypothetical protein BT96DRAFT_632295 [Gymnopus androsaceus JB14]|uniref:Uncharacterized protein n=1 Tax=Gymnopus androsaceus JB14 TaxID=1447944 RepID=A0A6A4HSD8_9AGAR|nr:hypothetical protein BT96DRAFT_632295 [Gymnopus androsaceus JB14]
MFHTLRTLWRSRDNDVEANRGDDHLTSPPSRPNHPKLQLNTSIIGPPIPRSPHSITGIDGYEGQWHPSPNGSARSAPSNIAWLRQHNPPYGPDQPSRPPAARLGMMVRHTVSIPLSRSLSSPASSSLHAHPAPRLGMHSQRAGSTHSLHTSTLYGDAYDYPLVKPLSPIVEQDYFSPDSLTQSIQLPPASATSAPSTARSLSTRDLHSIPFITRPVNRSLSQSTQRSGHSTSSSTVAPSPHQESDEAPLPFRPGKSSNLLVAMPTIPAGSSEEYDNGNDPAESSDAGDAGDTESVRAESFVTANENEAAASPSGVIPSIHELPSPPPPTHPPVTKPHEVLPVEFTDTEVSMIRSDGTSASLLSTRSPPSASESFIRRRWDKDAAYPSVAFKLKAKRQCFCTDTTPAFWAFWLGIFFPVLLFVGGWHFTHFGEQPERLTFWEFYFNAAYWKEVFCCGRGKLRWENAGESGVTTSKGKGKEKETYKKEKKTRHPPPLPRWITEKQSTDVKKARLNDAKRSLRGISFGYPFVPRPVVYLDPNPSRTTATRRAMQRILLVLSKPNRFLDQFYGVKLMDVHGKHEGPRRIFDPWIQRCRYAFCYAVLLLLAGLATAVTCLVIFSLRDFR